MRFSVLHSRFGVLEDLILEFLRGVKPAQHITCHFRQLFQSLHASSPPSPSTLLSFFRPRDKRLDIVPSATSRIFAISLIP